MSPEPPLQPAAHSPEIIPAHGGMPLTVQYARRTIRMHTVSETELDTVASLSNSIHLAFVGMSFGAFDACLNALHRSACRRQNPRRICGRNNGLRSSHCVPRFQGSGGLPQGKKKLKEIKSGDS